MYEIAVPFVQMVSSNGEIHKDALSTLFLLWLPIASIIGTSVFCVRKEALLYSLWFYYAVTVCGMYGMAWTGSSFLTTFLCAILLVYTGLLGPWLSVARLHDDSNQDEMFSAYQFAMLALFHLLVFLFVNSAFTRIGNQLSDGFLVWWMIVLLLACNVGFLVGFLAQKKSVP